MRIILRLALVTGGFAFVCGSAYAQQANPNKLPPCPPPDTSKKTDQERFAKWTNCWGRYKFELLTVNRGNVVDSEWLNGLPHGQGTYYHLADNPVKGSKYVGELKDGQPHGQGTYTYTGGAKYVGEFKDGLQHGQGTYTYYTGSKYVGEFKDDKKHGLGTYTHVNGDRYVGEFKDDEYHGQGIYTKADGSRLEGTWENDKFIRQAKVNLPNAYNNITTNTDRTDIDRERQQLAEERRRLEEQKYQLQTQAKNESNVKIPPTIKDTRRRLALVIGNASYKNSPLRNPSNDAALISKVLSDSGFIVARHDNLTYMKMREVVRTFGEKLSKGDVGLFYFAGHAVQYRGKNYLLPVNEDMMYSDEIPSSAMDIDLVLAKMESANNDLNIVILDACRTNPLVLETRNLERGLTTINAAKGTFIAFATSPGKVALDGTGSNSPYTKNLAQTIRKGGMTLEQVFKEVRKAVVAETNGQQVPWENSSLMGDFYFVR